MTNGDDAIKRPSRANDHGTLPAALASPAPSANEPESETSHQQPPRAPARPDDLDGPHRPDVSGLEALGGDPNDSEAAGIEEEYHRRIAGLRRLPRQVRAAALRAARDTRASALLALRQKRLLARHTRQIINRARRAGPG